MAFFGPSNGCISVDLAYNYSQKTCEKMEKQTSPIIYVRKKMYPLLSYCLF